MSYDNRVLLSIKEATQYTGIGMTKMRQIVNAHPEFRVYFPELNKIYLSKKEIDKWIQAHGNKTAIVK